MDTSPGNPRAPRPEARAPSRAGGPLLYLLLLVMGFLLFRSFFQEAGTRRVTYSEFKTAAEQGQFAKVAVAHDWVKGFHPPTAPADAGEKPMPWIATRVEGDEELVPLLEEKGIPYEGVADSGLGQLFWIWVVPLGIALLFWNMIMRRMGGMGQGPAGIMAFGKSRARVYSVSNTGVTFKDVAGVEEAVDELKEIVDFLKSPEKFRRVGGRIPKGVLLVGPPGTGKTLLARAIAGEAGVSFFSLSGSEFVEMFVGVGAARVRDLFAQAQAKAPCIIFIDELDAIGKSRNVSIVGGHDEREQTLNQLLAEMDGFDPRLGLIILGATNRPEILDPALLRPGRFDRQILVDKPDMRGREHILRIHARVVRLGSNVDLHEVARRTPGFAGADLANVVNESALLAARRGRDHVIQADLFEAIERVVAGLEKKNRRMNDREKEIVAYHESGHALVSSMLPHGDRVHKVSIIPRGLGALGYTMQLPLEDRYLMSKEELRDKLAGLLGGRAAEEIALGEISTGAANDLRQAAEIARLMAAEYGMSDELGPIALGDGRRQPLLGPLAQPAERNYSERTAQMLDAEVRAMIEEALGRAREIIRTHRDKLEALAERLLAVEVVEADELRDLLGRPERQARGGGSGHEATWPPPGA